jgi:hypothetical protein
LLNKNFEKLLSQIIYEYFSAYFFIHVLSYIKKLVKNVNGSISLYYKYKSLKFLKDAIQSKNR